MTDFELDIETTSSEVETVDLNPAGIYNFKGASPAEMVEKYAEYQDGEPVEESNYPAIRLFMVANQVAVYDENRTLSEVENAKGVALNCDFKLKYPDGTTNKKGLSKIKSWWMVSFGVNLPEIKNDKGVLVVDWDTVIKQAHNGEAWGSIQHFKTPEDKIVEFVGNRFSKEPPKKAPKEK